VWFDFVVPGPDERSWLRSKYPESWPAYDPIWDNITKAWQDADIGNDFAAHGTAIVTFCNMCQVVLCGGTPAKNTATTLQCDGKKFIFCSQPCRWIFEKEKERYFDHKDVVKRVLAGEAPGNLLALVNHSFGLSHESRGRDALRGDYPWMNREKVR
jgi:toluene monooxygenase system protein A